VKKKEPKVSHCANCKHAFENKHFDFCPSCGQKRYARLTMKGIIENMFSNYFSFDSKIINTIGPFLFNPGKVAKDYINGKRKHHVSPSQLYFFFSFILLLFITSLFVKPWETELSKGLVDGLTDINIDSLKNEINKDIQTESGEGLLKINDPNKEKSINNELSTGKGNAIKFHYGDSTDIDLKLVHQLILDGKTNEEIYPKVVKEEVRNWFNKSGVYFMINLVRNKGKGFIALLLSQITIGSLFALGLMSILLRLLYVRRNFSLAEHFVHMVFFFSFLCVLILATLVGYSYFKSDIWILPVIVISSLYLYRSMLVVYRQSWLKTTAKFILFFIGIYALILPIVFSIIFGISFIQYSQ